MAPTRIRVVIRTDQRITVEGLKDQVAGVYLNAATVAATLRDKRTATAVTNFTNIALSYVTASDGNYEGAIDDTFNPDPGSWYTLEVTVVEGPKKGYFENPCTVEIASLPITP